MPKQTTSNKIWIYLARRDKTGVRILAVFSGWSQPPTRIADLSIMQLPPAWLAEIARIVYDDRMMWEPWVESCEDFDALRTGLKVRGYTGLPLSGQPEVKTSFLSPSKASVTALPKKRAMVRRSSRNA